MKRRHGRLRFRSQAALVSVATVASVALAPFVAFATGACGGKVLYEAGGDDAGPVITSTGPTTASSGPTPPSPTATPPPTTTSTATATGTTTSPPVGTGLPFDGGVFNDGEPGSLVAIANGTACTIPSAVSSLENVAPVTVARLLAFCGPALHFVQCPSNDGVQCEGPSSDDLLFDTTCIDQCAADEYVVEVDRPTVDGGVPLPPSCHIPAGAPGFPSYCCPCAD